MPSATKRVLGRGLADLLPVGGNGANSGTLIAPGPGQEVPVTSLHANPRQPRTRFEEGPLAELTESVRANGVLQPILVRPRASGGYEIVAGERRYRAAIAAGLRHVPVVVRQLSDEDTLALALIENLIRQDIGPLEAARAYQRLMHDFGWTQEETGKRVGKSRSAVANTVRLLRLPEYIQQGLERGELSEGHARNLIGDDRDSDNPDFRDRQATTYRRIIEQGLSVRDVEKLMRGETVEPSHRPGFPTRPATPNPSTDTVPLSPAMESLRTTSVSKPATPSIPRPEPVPDPNLRALEDRLRDALGTRVRLVGSDTRGKLEIEYYSPDELDGLMQRLDIRPIPETVTNK
jgi:ParB family chromosome partitioning protein